jgi:hypothetical protein
MSEDDPWLAIVNMKHVVQISSDVHGPCEDCGDFRTDNNVGNAINHYLEHGYVLLHVGSQTTNDLDGKLRHSTVAIMGLKKAARW